MSQESNDSNEQLLSDEDQARVDHVVSTGVNSTNRKPFRPMLLIILLIATVTGLSLMSQLSARWSGIYQSQIGKIRRRRYSNRTALLALYRLV